MNVVVFEDHAVSQLGVLVAARPACDLTVGTTSLHEALSTFGAVHRVLRPELARYLAALAGRRIPLWGGPCDPAPAPAASRHGAVGLLVNARVVPSRDNLRTLRGLVEAGHRTVVHEGDSFAAAVLHLSPDGGGADDALVRRLSDGGLDAVPTVDAAGMPAAEARLELLGAAHEILGAHERALEGSLAIRLDGGRYREVRPGLFVAAGAVVAAEVAVRHGPVVVEAGAEIGPFVCLDGPLFIGPGARVQPRTWLKAGTVLGVQARAGGEIEATVMEPFSNKAHEGFLGHSHLGSWVNLAAGTVTSNLKATYGPVRLHEWQADGTRTTVHTARQFFGALIGDLARTAINSSIPCGARIGVAAAVQGSVAESVAPFTNDLLGGRSTAEQAAIVLGRMMARRGLAVLDADSMLLATLAGEGAA